MGSVAEEEVARWRVPGPDWAAFVGGLANLLRPLLLLLILLLLSHEGTGGLVRFGETAIFLLGGRLLFCVENGLGVVGQSDCCEDL